MPKINRIITNKEIYPKMLFKDLDLISIIAPQMLIDVLREDFLNFTRRRGREILIYDRV